MLDKLEKTIEFSTLPKTWILDLDGTILKHNGYKLDGHDSFLKGSLEFLQSISPNDMIIFITSRKKDYAMQTESFLKQHNIHYNSIIYEAPYGERVIINDNKPSGLKMAYAICTKRDSFNVPTFIINKEV